MNFSTQESSYIELLTIKESTVMDSLINTTATLSEGEELITRIAKKNTYSTPPFHSIGRSGTRYFYDSFGNKSVVEGIDVIPILINLPSCATWLFWTLLTDRDPSTNVCHLKTSRLSSCDLNKLKKGYKPLKDLQLLIRIKPEYYLINPKVFLPYNDHYPSVQLRWNNLINP